VGDWFGEWGGKTDNGGSPPNQSVGGQVTITEVKKVRKKAGHSPRSPTGIGFVNTIQKSG